MYNRIQLSFHVGLNVVSIYFDNDLEWMPFPIHLLLSITLIDVVLPLC